MKGVWLVAMLIGLLLTAWLLMRDVSDRAVVGPGPAQMKAVESAERAVQRQVTSDREKERRVENAGRE